jgi:hypothetical protein
VKVGKWTQDVVRFQGAIAGGDNTIFATLPVGYRPARTVYLSAAANGPVPARIIIGTNGVMQFDLAPLSSATVTLSLDGLSFGL